MEEPGEGEDPFGLGVPLIVPPRERHLPLEILVTTIGILFLAGIGLAIPIAGGVFAWNGFNTFSSSLCGSPGPVPSDVSSSAHEVVQALQAMPAVASAKPSFDKSSPGACANQAAYDAEPWITSFSVTMTANATSQQVAAVQEKVSPHTGWIVLEATTIEARLNFMLDTDASVPLPLALARRVGAIPGVSNIVMSHSATRNSTGMLVDADTASTISQVVGLLRDDPGAGTITLTATAADDPNHAQTFTINNP